jgi:hypothetical protein
MDRSTVLPRYQREDKSFVIIIWQDLGKRSLAVTGCESRLLFFFFHIGWLIVGGQKRRI